MNYLLEIDRLANRYFVMRHGHSLANELGIIVSHPENGCAGYGLSELGRSQVQQSLQRVSGLDMQTLIISSDFQRARESAGIAHSMLGCAQQVSLEARLRERDFGEFELLSDSSYTEIWRADVIDPDNRWRGVESVNQVTRRVTSVIVELEHRFTGLSVLLVSHGDALQILQTAFARQAASSHRELDHLHTAEIRQLVLAPGGSAAADT